MKGILDHIAHHAKTTPNKIALVTNNNSVSYGQLQTSIDLTTTELLQLKVHTLAIYMENSIDWIVTDLAAAKAQLTIIPIPLFFTPQQIKHLIIDGHVDAIACAEISSEQLPVQPSSITKSVCSDTQYLLLDCEFEYREEWAQCKVTYTSGSTGTPKGVCLSGETIDLIVSSLSQELKLVPIQKHLSLIPFATLLENVAGTYVALYLGRTVIVDSVEKFGLTSNHEFLAEKLITSTLKYQANSIILLPQMLKLLVEHERAEDLSCLKFIAVGGGKLSPDLIELCRSKKLDVFEGYGLSECGSVVCLNTPVANRIGAVGRPLSHVDVHIDETGEVIVRGCAMQGYLGNEETTTNEIATGDVGYFDDDGFLFITGRKKNTIVSSFGRNISPEWVESTFLSNPKIQQIAVFGEAKPYLSAIIVADKNTSRPVIQDIIDTHNQSLPDYAQVKNWQLSRKQFTTSNRTITENGKLRRSEIYQQHQTFIDIAEEIA